MWVGRLIDDAEMEQHPLGVADRGEVVLVTLAGAVLSSVAYGRELIKVFQGEFIDTVPGLDQQADGDLGTSGDADPVAEPESLCCGQEPVDLVSQRAGADLAPNGGKLAFQQVVIPPGAGRVAASGT